MILLAKRIRPSKPTRDTPESRARQRMWLRITHQFRMLKAKLSPFSLYTSMWRGVSEKASTLNLLYLPSFSLVQRDTFKSYFCRRSLHSWREKKLLRLRYINTSSTSERRDNSSIMSGSVSTEIQLLGNRLRKSFIAITRFLNEPDLMINIFFFSDILLDPLLVPVPGLKVL